MKLLQTNWIILLLSFSVSVNAAPGRLTWDKQVQRGTLDNGLNYYIYNSENKSDPFNLRLIVHAGSIDEPQVKGIAHGVEHMVFNHTQAHPETVQRYLRHIGWRTGKQINAKTQPASTQYMLRTRPNDALDLKGSLQLLTDIIGHAQFNEPQWLLEKQIITEEKRLGESVVKRLSQQIKHSTKANSKYAQGSTIGSYQSINDISLNDLQLFYQKNYVASNMSLVASGYFDTAKLKKLITETLGQLPTYPKPQRLHVNFPLDTRIKMNKVQDKQGSTSKVALGLRMAIPAKNTLEGIRLRLNNYLIRKLVFAQIRANKDYLPDSVTLITAVLKEPTNERLTFAFAAKTTDHQAGLKAILSEIERLKRYGLSQQALQTRLTYAREMALQNVEAANSRDFAKWEDKITEAIFTGGILLSPTDKLALINQLLDEVTLSSINQQLTTLLNAPDTFIYYQAPEAVSLTLPTEAQVKQWQAQLRSAEIKPPLAIAAKKKHKPQENKEKPQAVIPVLMKPVNAAPLLANKHYAQQAVQEWTLDNGNRVVWLNKATANGKIHLKAISDIGYHNQQQAQWLANSALQIYQQSAPAQLEQAQWSQWQKEQGALWQFKLHKHHLDVSIVSEKEQLDATFHAFWLNHQQRVFNQAALDAVKKSVQEKFKPSQNDHEKTSTLIYAQKNDNQQQLKLLNALNVHSLSNSAMQLINQAHTLFIVGELEQEQLQKLIATYLSPLENAIPLTPKRIIQRPGAHYFTQQKQGNIQTKVNIYGQIPMIWTPEDAFMLSALNPVVQQALSQRLRLELAGVYRVRFEMKLDPDTDQMSSELSFISAPERAQTLAHEAQKVLTNIIPFIKKMNIERVQENIRFAEKSRLKQASTWLRRLMLSYRQYNHPRYVDSMQNLADELSKTRLINLAKQVLPMPHQVQINTQYTPN